MAAATFWAGIIASIVMVGCSYLFLRREPSPDSSPLAQALVVLLACIGAAGLVLFGTVGILHLAFGPLIR